MEAETEVDCRITEHIMSGEEDVTFYLYLVKFLLFN